MYASSASCYRFADLRCITAHSVKETGEEALMRRIDEVFTLYPFYGYRRITVTLRRDGFNVNGQRILHLHEFRTFIIESLFLS